VNVAVPDIGDFSDVPVIEILVKVGDTVAVEDPLVVLESDKATMEIPAPVAGVVEELLVSAGDLVSQGTLIARLAVEGVEPAPPADAPPAPVTDVPADAAISTQVLVLGSGPGGYTAAFRAADLGLDVVLVERYATLGGVCLNVGCIPSKALLHVAKVVTDAQHLEGVGFGEPQFELDALRGWKDGVVGKLTKGVAGMAKQRGVRVLEGTGRFTGPHSLEVNGETVAFEHAIVAAGSRAATLPGFPEDDPRVVDSTGALELPEVPERLLVVGGGIIGLEMATVYDALGSRVTVVEMADQLIPGCDPDLVKPLHRAVSGRYDAILLETTVEAVDAREDALHVTFSSGDQQAFDRILVAVGRKPNGGDLGLDSAGVHVDERGFVPVDEQQRTNVPHILAIGDVVGAPMLAHKATHEAKVAAEVIAGQDVAFDVRGIPSVAYTDPEVAWVGLTEGEAEAEGIPYEKAAFPWAASGRALSIGAPAGLTKLLLDPDTRRVLGAGIVGAGAGELIAETGLALELGADAEDIGLTIHAHPTLSETVAFAAEVAEGTITDLPPQRRPRSRA
jgi:dihydrolipoamide dehydrogenase